jgi:7-keto-8-aminopelargonate synthetase-like enzyme
MPQRNWRKIGTNRSKNGKVIYRRFDMSEQRGCHVPGFIVTSALPPLTRAAATPAVRRIGDASGIRNGPHGSKPYSTPRAAPMPSDAHMVPVLVADPERCKAPSDLLLTEHHIFMQLIHYPAVPLRNEAVPDHEKPLIRQRAQRCSPQGPRGCVGKGRDCAEVLGSGS